MIKHRNKSRKYFRDFLFNHENARNTLLFVSNIRRIKTMRETNYIYLSTQRPISFGTYPKQNLVQFENFDDTLILPHTEKRAYGYLEYSKPLSEKELSQYELQIYEPDIFKNTSICLLNGHRAVDCDLESKDENRTISIENHALENKAIVAAMISTLYDQISDIYACVREESYKENAYEFKFKILNIEDFLHDFHTSNNLRQTDYGINQNYGSLVIRKYDSLMPIQLPNTSIKDYEGDTMIVDFVSINRVPKRLKEQLSNELDSVQIRDNEYKAFHEKFNINEKIMDMFIACIESVGVIEPDSIKFNLDKKDRVR